MATLLDSFAWGEASDQQSAATLLGSDSNESEFVFIDYGEYQAKRSRIAEKEASAIESLHSLVGKAKQALTSEIITVVDKKRVPPSGDKQDYLSLAPYWWPDPDKPDGLPYIRRDGEVNPTTRDAFTDFAAKQQLFDSLPVLVDAFFFTGDDRYQKRALEWLDAWFVNSATRMNPNLDYAQGIPGVNDGRCFGIIEWVGIGNLITPIQILRAANGLPATMDEAIVKWFEEYAQWLQFSSLGIEERERSNNHGTWYDVQLTAIRLFLGEREEARRILEAVKQTRIAVQIEPDGSQPREIERTKSLSYSAMNLRAFTQLAWFGRKLGVELWNYETPDGRSIWKAHSFLEPYVVGDHKWPHPQLGDIESLRAKFRSQIKKAESQFGPINK